MVSLFLFTATIDVALAIFVLVQMRSVEPVPEAERAVFTPHPPISHGTQAMLELQPSAGFVEEPHAPWADSMEGTPDDQS